MLSPSTTFRREGRNFVLLRQIYRLVSPSPFLPPPPFAFYKFGIDAVTSGGDIPILAVLRNYKSRQVSSIYWRKTVPDRRGNWVSNAAVNLFPSMLASPPITGFLMRQSCPYSVLTSRFILLFAGGQSFPSNDQIMNVILKERAILMRINVKDQSG